MIRCAFTFLADHRDAIVAAWAVGCATVGLCIGTGVIGPTLDSQAQAKAAGDNAAYAAR